MCLYNRIMLNKKYTETKKNAGNPPAFTDSRVKYVPIGCERCMECRKKKAREWQMRLMEDIKENKDGKFITLTFSNESIKELCETEQLSEIKGYELDNAICRIAVRRFLERWRKKTNKSVRHWFVSELGHNGTENIHMHGIIWTNKSEDFIKEKWKYGYIWTGQEMNGKKINYVNSRTVNYIVKYIHKTDELHSEFKSAILSSKGIGSCYLKTDDSKKHKFNGEKTNELYTFPNGTKAPICIYWRNKIYTEKEREQLWLIKLDKELRFVCGEKVDVSVTEEHYIELREYYRTINKKLGYGSDIQDWEEREYQQKRREIMQSTRLKKAKAEEKEIKKKRSKYTWEKARELLREGE